VKRAILATVLTGVSTVAINRRDEPRAFTQRLIVDHPRKPAHDREPELLLSKGLKLSIDGSGWIGLRQQIVEAGR
jgi:hypothetical protein